jgi:hypothetical protein
MKKVRKSYLRGESMGVCSLCTDEIKEKDTTEYTQICGYTDCKTPVMRYYRFCRSCSEKYDTCEVCGIRLKKGEIVDG